MTGRHSPQRPHRDISQQTPLSDTFHRDLILKPHTNVTETSQTSLQHRPRPETIHKDRMWPQRYFTARPHRETSCRDRTQTPTAPQRLGTDLTSMCQDPEHHHVLPRAHEPLSDLAAPKRSQLCPLEVLKTLLVLH